MKQDLIFSTKPFFTFTLLVVQQEKFLFMPFQNDSAICFQQTLDGRLIQKVSPPAHLINQSFDGEVFTNYLTPEYDLYNTASDTLYHYNIEKNTLEPKFTKDFGEAKFISVSREIQDTYFISFESEGLETDTIKFIDRNILKKDWHNYGYRLYRAFGSFASSPNLGKSFEVADHLWLDYLYNFLLQVEPFPHAKVPYDIDLSYYKDFSQSGDKTEARDKAEIFLDGLNEFYKEIDFEKYLNENSVFYDKVLVEVAKGTPDNSFIELNETFYKKEFSRYVLIPSLTTPKGMGFGLRHHKNGTINVFNVFGAFDYQFFDNMDSLKMGFDKSESLNELSAHEFGHSFVNQVIDEVPDSIINQSERLFEPIKNSMSDQGYNTWKVCMYEHFVRAGEIYLWSKLGDVETSDRLKKEYINKRNFIFIPNILIEIENYDKGKYPSYSETVKVTLINLMED